MKNNPLRAIPLVSCLLIASLRADEPAAVAPHSQDNSAPAAASAQTEEKQAGSELEELQRKLANGVAVPAETLAAAHERFLLARYAANRERAQQVLAARRQDPEARALRRAVAAAPSAAARHALLARNLAVSKALESERPALPQDQTQSLLQN